MFELAFPWALLLIFLPFVVWALLPEAEIKLPVAVQLPFFAAIKGIINQKKNKFSANKNWVLPALIWTSLVFALAGPRWVGEPIPLTRASHHIMLALDLSGSMELPDMAINGQPSSRLAVVKRAAKQFVRDQEGDKMGLILFGTKAYLQTPLTYDKNNILLRIDDATAGLAGKTTSIGDAVGLAVKHLDKVANKGRVIILLTDGANTSGVLSPNKAAELAKNDGIKLYTIGLGAKESDNVFLPFSPAADLDEGTLKNMAKITGGRYFRATDLNSLHSIYQNINQLETSQEENVTIRPEKEYYPWCIALALLLYGFWLFQTKKVHHDH